MKKFIILIITMLTISSLHAESWWELEDASNSLFNNASSIRITDSTYVTKAERINNSYNKKYIVELEISQSHYTLSLSEHMKDAMNKFTMEIPVDVDFYNSVRVGETLDSRFRVGSMLLRGSYGKWKVRVVNKYTK